MSEHFIERWACGHLAAQCRCASPDKESRYRAVVCPACALVAAEATYPQTHQVYELLDFLKIPVARRTVALRAFAMFLAEVEDKVAPLKVLAEAQGQEVRIGFEWTDNGPQYDPVIGLTLPPGGTLN